MFPYKEKIAEFERFESTKLITPTEKARKKEKNELLHDTVGALVTKLQPTKV